MKTMRIMAVTKKVPIEQILPVLKNRQITLIGESRWQDAKVKLPLLPNGIEKHFIGHLQTNKVKEVVEAFDCIESVDSLKLATAINKVATELKKVFPIFLQVNISNDPAKFGFLVNELPNILANISQYKNIKIIGLMTITAKESEQEVRIDFKKMKQLQQAYNLPELSMGMSADWEIAVEEGATIVRLGRALFN